MIAAFWGKNIVSKAALKRFKLLGVDQGRLNHGLVNFFMDIENVFMARRATMNQMANIGDKTALEILAPHIKRYAEHEQKS